MEGWHLLILGIYTVVYLIVFIIQYRHIKSLKTINQSMVNFMSVFKIDEVHKYADMRDKTKDMELDAFLKKFDEENKILDDTLEKRDKIIELYWVCIGTVSYFCETRMEGKEFIEEHFPLLKDTMSNIMEPYWEELEG